MLVLLLMLAGPPDPCSWGGCCFCVFSLDGSLLLGLAPVWVHLARDIAMASVGCPGCCEQRATLRVPSWVGSVGDWGRPSELSGL